MAWLEKVISMSPLPGHAVRLQIMVTVASRTRGPAARAREVHAAARAVTGSSSEPQSNPAGTAKLDRMHQYGHAADQWTSVAFTESNSPKAASTAHV